MFRWYRKENFTLDPRWRRLRWTLLLTALAVMFIGWLVYTPPGLWGKLSAIGYAVCHQAPTHSFHLQGRVLPLCARCTGMYLGALIGLVLQFLKRNQRQSAFPKPLFLAVFGILLAVFAFDGFNSLFADSFGVKLYQTQNWMRLLTGAGLGWGMAAMVVPVFHQTIWAQAADQPFFHHPRQLLLLAGITAVPLAGILLGVPWVLWLVAVLTALTVPAFLSVIYMLLLVMLTFRENSFNSWRPLLPYWLGGVLVTLLQLFVFALVRFNASGTWAGFPLP
jgi:uncharacterized membrane protein